MSDFSPHDPEESLFRPGRKSAPYDSDDSDDDDDDPLHRRNCIQRCIPKRRNREFILGLIGGVIVVSLLLTVVILSLTTRANRPTVVILVSLDGYAAQYLTAPGFEHPNLDKIAARGAKVQLVPVFPSLTFPSHWAMITGLHPESNGIIANHFQDPATGRIFSYTNSTEANDPFWWKGEPFWTTVQKAGLKSASFFWPGSDVNASNPTYNVPYDGTIPNEQRIKKVIEWLDMDWSQRPSFITLYMSDVDTAGHRFGPDSPQVRAAVKAVDDQLGTLLLAIENEGRQNRLLIDLIVVSDHGMSPISPNRTILIDRLINMTDVFIPDLGGAVASIWPKNDSMVDDIVGALQTGAIPLTVYRKRDIPEDYRYRNNDRVAPIIAVADLGWMITTSDTLNAHPTWYEGGAHGYDPRQREMHGILVAYGPHIRNTENNNQIIGPVPNIQVYNLLGCILGIPSAPNNGTFPCEPNILTDRTMRSARFRKDPSVAA